MTAQIREPEVDPAVGKALVAAIQETLAVLEKAGVSARAADEYIRDCAFEAWWNWDYEGPDSPSLSCGVCGHVGEDVIERGYTDEGAPMETCEACGGPES